MSENQIKEHKIILTNRKVLNITGINKVNSINENYANIDTANGTLIINGKQIKMKKLLVDDGIAEMEGEFDAFKYVGTKQSGNFFKRIFK